MFPRHSMMLLAQLWLATDSNSWNLVEICSLILFGLPSKIFELSENFAWLVSTIWLLNLLKYSLIIRKC